MTPVLSERNIVLVNSLRNAALKSSSDFNAVKFFADLSYAKECLVRFERSEVPELAALAVRAKESLFRVAPHPAVLPVAPLGVLLGSNERAYRSVEFLIDFFRSTPSSALIPLFLLIFGTSNINKVAIAAFGAFLIVVFNSAYGVINARKQRVMAAKVMGASRWQIFRDVLVWESLQPSFVGLRSAVSMALVIVIVAEMFIGADSGLGNRIINAQQVMNVRDMYASILAAGALGYALNILFLLLERKIVHWSGR